MRLGSQTPRVARFPDYAFTAAPEVIDFAKFNGLLLDPWQQFILTHGMGQDFDEEWTAKRVSVWVPRQNGKGAVIEALELAWLFLPGFEVELVIHSAHEHRTTNRAYKRLEKLCKRNRDLHKRVRQYRQTNGQQRIELLDGRELEYSTRSDTAIRGFSAPRVVLDEAQELNSDQMAAIGPAVSAMDFWQMWFFGTPPKDPAAWCYGLREDGEAGTERLAHFDWGIGIVDQTKPSIELSRRIASIDTAYECNPAMGIRIKPETVLDEMKPSGLGPEYAKERLGAWKKRALVTLGIDPKQWADLADPESKRSGDLALGVDISVMRDFASINVFGLRDDGLGHGQLVDYRAGTAWLPGRIAELALALDPVAIGMGKGTYESLKEDLKKVGLVVPEDPAQPLRGQLAVTNPAEMSAACAQLVDAIKHGKDRYVPSIQLDEAAMGAKLNPTGDTIAWARKDSAGDISPLGGLTVGRWAYYSRIDRLVKPPEQEIFAAWR